METNPIDLAALLSAHATETQSVQLKGLRRRSRRLASVTADTVGQPTNLAGIASLLLHHHRKQLAQQLSPEVHDHA